MEETLHYLTKQSIWSELVVSVLSGNEKKFFEIKNNLVSAYETNEEQRLVKRSAPQDIPPDHFATVSPEDDHCEAGGRKLTANWYILLLNQVERH
jgi:hypothetical protein